MQPPICSLRKAIIVFLLLCLVVIYYNLDPAKTIFYPKCIFHILTGYDCPSCGGQRALYALLHGRWLDAVKLNPFLLVSIPYAIAVFYTSFSKSETAVYLKPFIQHRYAVIGYVLLFVFWWVFRNTDLWQSIVIR